MRFKLKNRHYLGLGMMLMSQGLPSYAASLSAQGFGSFYYGQALNANLLPEGFKNTGVDFTDFSLVGADLTAKLDDEWSVLSEVIAQGQPATVDSYSNFTNFVQWAFLQYKPNENMTVKFGRQRYALWMASEYINTHHSMPYRNLPQILYKNAPMNSFDGIFISQGFDVGIGKFDIAAFGGAPLLDMNLSSATLTLSNLYGARAVLLGDGWRIRAQASQVYVSADVASKTIEDLNTIQTLTHGDLVGPNWNGHERIISFGYRFDKYNIVSWGEYNMINTPDGTSLPSVTNPLTKKSALSGGKFLDTAKGGYLMIGYHLDKFTPRYTYASVTSNIGINGDTGATTHTFGLDYLASDKVTLRAEYERLSIPNAGKGLFSMPDQPDGATDTSGSSFYVGADFII